MTSPSNMKKKKKKEGLENFASVGGVLFLPGVNWIVK